MASQPQRHTAADIGHLTHLSTLQPHVGARYGGYAAAVPPDTVLAFCEALVECAPQTARTIANILHDLLGRRDTDDGNAHG